MIRPSEHETSFGRDTLLTRTTSVRSGFNDSDTSSNQEQSAKALQILFDACLSARLCNRSLNEFAVEISELTDAGVAKHVLMHLICQGDILHLRETTLPNQTARRFSPQPDIALSNSSCFVLSENGFEKAARANQIQETQVINKPVMSQPTEAATNNKPEWDSKLRELRFAGFVVKFLRWPAANQERVIEAFAEEGWPCRIDDPLPPHQDICAKRRLHDTIKCLNRKQKHPIIRFRGDGTGKGVILQINTEELAKAIDIQKNGTPDSNGLVK